MPGPFAVCEAGLPDSVASGIKSLVALLFNAAPFDDVEHLERTDGSGWVTYGRQVAICNKTPDGGQNYLLNAL